MERISVRQTAKVVTTVSFQAVQLVGVAVVLLALAVGVSKVANGGPPDGVSSLELQGVVSTK